MRLPVLFLALVVTCTSSGTIVGRASSGHVQRAAPRPDPACQGTRSNRGAQDLLHGRTNVLAGARNLRRLLVRFGSAGLALAAYNAGPAAVERAGGQTITYVANVTAAWRSLRGCT